MATNSTVLGVVTIARHGDRTSFYQNPMSYAGSDTYLTAEGEVQEYQTGQYLQSVYGSNASASAVSPFASLATFNQSYFKAYADAGDEGGVIFDSAVALMQGLFPPTPAQTIALANGTNIESPLSGYQYVPITSVLTQSDYATAGFSLEGFTSCPAFTSYTNAVYNSSSFVAFSQQVAPELDSLQNLVDGKPLALSNAYNIYDFIHVNSLHNSSFLALTTPSQLATAQWLGDYHEAALFTSPEASSVGNIAWNAMAPGVLSALGQLSNSSSLVRWYHFQISYKPFISFFNLTDVPLTGIVDYASHMALELRQASAGGEPVVRLQFRNGSTGDATTYPMFGNAGDTPLSQFESTLSSSAITSLGQWCSVCNQTSARGCDLITLVNTTQAQLSAMQRSGNSLSLGAAGGIGAGVTLGVVFIVLGLAAALGFVSFGRKPRAASSEDDSSGPSTSREK